MNPGLLESVVSLKHDDEEQRFRILRSKYLSVYLVVMGADWLQGPYLYKLYQSSYGLDLVQIASLFLTGFMSGAIAGTLVSSTADTCGRRRVCVVFCATAILALSLRLVQPTFPYLVLSHILSGMASSMQHSVLEAWYVAEHHTQLLPSEWVARTFATGAFLNGIVAILAGMVANAVVDTWGLWAPFALAIMLLAIAGSMVMATWQENFGRSKGGSSIQVMDTLVEGLHVLWNDSNILILGAAQTVFECAMYIFVLLYTPAIENVHAFLLEQGHQHHDLPLGYLFSTMMFAIMVGSLTFQKLERRPMFANHKERLLIPALGCASISFAVMAYDHATSLPILLVAYHIFEFTTGLFHPSLSSLKADVIPEETRAVVMTMLRIPMNIGVGLAMWHADTVPIDYHFAICALITLFGCILVGACYQPPKTTTIA
ncbi:hypothetical protein O0I10_011075 [Lichtheimia ornata]|uniref:Molybdate-anion transporter n=1 Tax=Lichtheimia ornata TaxID=688661 RepID=A0AAD7XX21_9FUNG|nr:uncharacterized protein O0I10_011075 [Lichtheimia ornata]KAJ8653227.1 hypothetical protein O0I10_011075 [Lichtheimia ornata]